MAGLQTARDTEAAGGKPSSEDTFALHLEADAAIAGAAQCGQKFRSVGAASVALLLLPTSPGCTSELQPKGLQKNESGQPVADGPEEDCPSAVTVIDRRR